MLLYILVVVCVYLLTCVSICFDRSLAKNGKKQFVSSLAPRSINNEKCCIRLCFGFFFSVPAQYWLAFVCVSSPFFVFGVIKMSLTCQRVAKVRHVSEWVGGGAESGWYLKCLPTFIVSLFPGAVCKLKFQFFIKFNPK